MLLFFDHARVGSDWQTLDTGLLPVRSRWRNLASAVLAGIGGICMSFDGDGRA
jgi:hypothetical protein